MALLLIILAMFAFLGLGSGSSTTSHAEPQRAQPVSNGACVVVTWEAGKLAHQRPCHRAPAKP